MKLSQMLSYDSGGVIIFKSNNGELGKIKARGKMDRHRQFFAVNLKCRTEVRFPKLSRIR